MSRIPGTEIDLLNVPPDSPPELAAHLKSIWLNETGRECLVLSGAIYCGTVRADVVSAEVIDGFTAHDMAQAREEGYSAGVQRAIQIERVLTDLIAELRPYLRYDFVDTQVLNVALSGAEARLREVSGGE